MSNSRRIDNNTFGDNARIHQGDIHNVHNYPQERRETPPPPSQLIPFPRDPDFVNRGDILDRIFARCLEPAGRVALVGLGGVGKSQLAIEFAHRFSEEHKNIWIFWIHAATQARVQEGFRLIADAVKLPERKQAKADVSLLVKNWLSIEHNGRWVIILDSADDSEVLYSTNENGYDKRSLAAYIPKSRNGSILLTTRNRGLASKLTGGYKHIIDIDTMSEMDALILLERKMGSLFSPLDAGLAEDLVKALECIPLAISQAAAYIQARGPRSSIEKYLAEFRKSERESMRLLKYEANDLGRDEETSNTVLRTWAMSFEYIHSHQPSAADLLSLMSFFDRQGIPEWVLRDCTTRSNSVEGAENSESETGHESDSDTSSSFEEDISILRNYCLIAVNEKDDQFEMHRLVQLSIKGWLKASKLQETFMQRYIILMATKFPLGQEFEAWAICQDLFAHVQVALDYQPNEDTVKQWATLLYRGGVYAQVQGRYTIAEQMANKSKQAREKTFGKDDGSTLQSISLLADIIADQGRWDEAEELRVQVMEVDKVKLGADHPDTLKNMDKLAVIYWRQGRWGKAEKLEIQVLEARKAKLGADHRNTLTSMNNLASIYADQGRLEEAEKLLVQVVEACKVNLGADHLNTLINMGNLASTYLSQGRWNEAEELCVQVFEACKAKFGADYIETLISMNNLILIYWRQGRQDEAEELGMQAFEVCKATLGVDHPDTLSSMRNLALVYQGQGRWDEAEKLQVQVLKAHKKTLGADHPDTLISMNNLAITWKMQGRHEDALALMKDCVQKRQRVFGPQHPNTMRASKRLQKLEQ
ncbi:kinesin light chain [Trichoderma guizhouense]|uniref:Kinesin light chain n=1 Tax=Trichoderma guizhouense TaxID=1491466 RepID=A0A1T3CIP4_9HYPO|nr:kinesin light chain [Trichoderma guizhouense]